MVEIKLKWLLVHFDWIAGEHACLHGQDMSATGVCWHLSPDCQPRISVGVNAVACQRQVPVPPSTQGVEQLEKDPQ